LHKNRPLGLIEIKIGDGDELARRFATGAKNAWNDLAGDRVMATSKTIAALLGPTLIAYAVSVFLNLDAWPGIVDQAFRNPALIFAVAISLFVVGLAIVHFHNQWTGGWPVVVTVLGWLAVIGGLLRMLFPTGLAGVATTAVQTSGVVPVIAVIIFLVGAFLSFKAYSRE
jgi:hypothetical protein